MDLVLKENTLFLRVFSFFPLISLKSLCQYQICPLVALLLIFPFLPGMWHTGYSYKMLQDSWCQGTQILPNQESLTWVRNSQRVKLILIFTPSVFLFVFLHLYSRAGRHFLISTAVSSVFTFECPAWDFLIPARSPLSSFSFPSLLPSLLFFSLSHTFSVFLP